MENVKTFVGHLYFSLVIILIAVVGLSLLLYLADAFLTLGISGYFAAGNIKVLAGLWILASLLLAGWLTYQTAKERPREHIVFTRRIKE